MQLAVLNTGGATTTVAPGRPTGTTGHTTPARVFDTFMRDVDFAPNGSYFVVSTTGAFAGGVGSGTMCDTVSCWETASTGNDPSWVNYTGGDTTYGVAVTGSSAVYVGGHMRWQNNPFQGDQAGPGAVPRRASPRSTRSTACRCPWNPGRTRGVGAQALFATSQGLWVGSDTTKIGGETHGRVALMPLAGGTTVPAVAATLPNDLFVAPRTAGGVDNVLYRVNAAGPGCWQRTAVATGRPTRVWSAAATPPTGAAPSRGTPRCRRRPGRRLRHRALGTAGLEIPGRRGQERHGPALLQPGQEHVQGRPASSTCSWTGSPSCRTSTSWPPRATGPAPCGRSPSRPTGTASTSICAPSTGTPGERIEIVDNAAASTAPQRRAVDATGAPTASPSTANRRWTGRPSAAPLLDDTVYYGLSDGSLYKRSFDSTTGALGTQRVVNLYDDPQDGQRIPFAIANLTGMFYDTATHRIYYTVRRRPAVLPVLHPRERSRRGPDVPGGGQRRELASAAGLTLASGRIPYGSSADGALRSVPFAGGRVTGTRR